MIKHYRKKPVVVETIEWDGKKSTFEKIKKWNKNTTVNNDILYIPTLEGIMKAQLTDIIIKGVKGEIYPCRQDIFHETYEEV